MFTFTPEMIDRLAEVSDPHIMAIYDEFEAAFPNVNPEAIHTAAVAFQLGVLLRALPDDDRPLAVDLINRLLAVMEVGYTLAVQEAEAGGHARAAIRSRQ